MIQNKGWITSERNPTLDLDSVLMLSLVVPVYNEASIIGVFLERVGQVFDQNDSIQLEIIFVNDGSTDITLDNLLAVQQRDCRVRIIDLSRNFGKEAALTAGLQTARGQVIVPIDVDLQDPPKLILNMIAKWREGFDVVLARRINRDSDSRAKRISAKLFYRIHNKISDSKIPEDVGDFRLMDRAVIDALNKLPESRRFMKGLFAWVGFRTAYVDYVRESRVAGATKFSGWHLWNYALEGLTSFGSAPLRIWLYIGSVVALLSFLFALFIVVRVLIYGVDVPGYASVMVAVTFLGGLQLIGIGVVGEYLGRTYIEAKRRPVYLVRHIYEPKD